MPVTLRAARPDPPCICIIQVTCAWPEAGLVLFSRPLTRVNSRRFQKNKTRNLRCGSLVARSGRFSNRFLGDLGLVAKLTV